ncbi:Uncharacterized WD repeat-containing protein C1235.09 [Taphrina deformans PYCC 5710]|uniref:Uncharacterized WD repeat-containing protein C1235.09 n=1 Tax=Taphrina deformans (strain PYCC 5710 / ATCC 11124 / CBS 356.35 / IMI 108563 / JCM 9778 / NBRC 8474) TaxID=1097556 RepID=R4XB96_TAPDE|nr:Uncharacterized WD repeat-containing protein C1235.09 [Taphrina deformans PYCC 5710]|eukprot:CCG83114.1 Uncharacterized WD repeat-containing protein C1235.09 [Taphrina deformans PYCC 5710]
MAINSDQVNYLVLRYLAESGFEHTAFALKNEMRNAKSLEDAWATRVPTGHLVNSLQRAMMFEECMAQIDENGGEKDPAEVIEASLIPAVSSAAKSQPDTNGSEPVKRRAAPTEKTTSERVSSEGQAPEANMRKTSPTNANSTHIINGEGIQDVPMSDVAEVPPKASNPIAFMDKVIPLEGHSAGLDQCSWSPTQQNTIATSSVDGTARIWTLPLRREARVTSVQLNCTPSRTKDRSVTCIAWSKNGQSLSTGSYDGVTRIWNSAGIKQHRDLAFHTGPIFAMKWSRRGDFLLTGAADGLVGIWNTALGTLQQKWDLGSPVMDLEWISDALFLSACKGGTLKMWQLGRDAHVKRFMGHPMDINVLRWNSNINLGATGADDNLVKVWRADSENPTQVLKFHKSQIHALEWAPKDFGDYRLLASSSRDGQVCVWDVVRGELLHVLQHDRAIFTLHFSPTNLLATAGAEGETTVWNAETGRPVAVHRAPDAGMVYNVRFSNNGEKLAMARANVVGMVADMPPV